MKLVVLDGCGYICERINRRSHAWQGRNNAWSLGAGGMRRY